MKTILSNARRNAATIAVNSILILLFVCAAQAQTNQLTPFVDCVEREFNGSGAATGNYIAYFGYINDGSQSVTIQSNSPRNFFTPIPSPPGQPSVFYPGAHHRVVAVVMPLNSSETWFLSDKYVSSVYDENNLCGDGGANSRLITYQGRLSDGANAANGQYDLRFQLFDAATGGAARSSAISVEDVPATNGIFTVQLDFGKTSAIYGAGNLFVEIGVRAGTSTEAYTVLAPRQPLTATPLAMRSSVANNAFNAFNADRLGGLEAKEFILNSTNQQANANFNISGNGTIGGTLSANTINAVSANQNVFRGVSSSTVGTRLVLQNTTTGGAAWNVISTGSANGEGAGKLIFFNETSNTAPLQINGEGANISGNLTVSGSISGASKNFKIDHPLDPANKTLTYTSVESPDMLNIYNGNATTDAAGEAIVTMPDYFEALNRDFRYQLTVIGTFAQAIVLEEITGNKFKIKTDKPNVKVSWQVTGIRRDKFAKDNEKPVEEEKSATEKGRCIYAPACSGEKPKK